MLLLEMAKYSILLNSYQVMAINTALVICNVRLKNMGIKNRKHFSSTVLCRNAFMVVCPKVK